MWDRVYGANSEILPDRGELGRNAMLPIGQRQMCPRRGAEGTKSTAKTPPAPPRERERFGWIWIERGAIRWSPGGGGLPRRGRRPSPPPWRPAPPARRWWGYGPGR